ncbi:stage III sporulation AE [Babesia ovata]|uniref:Stage III sporulation AE n=1 Tax=Babesia ovata TaxID=189622 RepID=A0A2H6KCJ7_9APIC|nr:stage III sporulation AE [Babesia ovata]GBE60707.1 stage III sporulation AE [Babesia ovata]
MSISVDFNRNDPNRARQRLIAEYNRKPSIYVENNPLKSCLKVPATVAGFVGDLFQPAAHLQEERRDCVEEAKSTPDLAAGAPRIPMCDVIDLSVYKVLQRALCYAGAGLGLVGVGLVTFFGLFTAAGATCAVAACNKISEDCHTDTCNPNDNEVYYEGKPIVNTHNSYTPGSFSTFSPMYAPSTPPHWSHDL